MIVWSRPAHAVMAVCATPESGFAGMEDGMMWGSGEPEPRADSQECLSAHWSATLSKKNTVKRSKGYSRRITVLFFPIG